MRQIEKELNVKKWIQKRRLDLMESKEMKDEWNNLLLLILIILEIILRGKLKDKIREIKYRTKSFNIKQRYVPTILGFLEKNNSANSLNSTGK